MSVSLKDVLLYAGADCLSRFGRLSWLTSPGEENPEVFARNSVAHRIDEGGLLRQAAVDVPAIEWLDLDADGVRETPVVLAEPARTNLVIRSKEIDNGAWTRTNLATVTANASLGPDGAASLEKIVEDASGAVAHSAISTAFTITDGATITYFAFLRAAERTWGVLQINNTADAAQRVRVYYNLATGVVGTAAGAGGGTHIRSGIVHFGGGLYLCWLTGTIGAGITSVRARISPANADNGVTYSGDGTSGIYAGWAQVEEGGVPSSLIETVAASAARPASLLYFPFPWKRMGLTALVDFHWRDLMASAGGILHIGSATAGTDPRLSVLSSGSYFQAVHDSGSTTSTATLAAAPAYGDRVELLVTVDPDDGHVTISQSINQGAATTATDATAVSLAAQWAAERLYLGSTGSTGVSLARFRSVKVARGIQTLADMRALFP